MTGYDGKVRIDLEYVGVHSDVRWRSEKAKNATRAITRKMSLNRTSHIQNDQVLGNWALVWRLPDPTMNSSLCLKRLSRNVSYDSLLTV